MTERRILKGKLSDLEEQKRKAELKMRSLCERIGVIVNPLISELPEMAIPEGAALMDDLVVEQANLIRLSSQISDIKEELYG